MKIIAKVIFKIHKLIFKYPTRSEIRLVIEGESISMGLDWYIGMLYICGESIEEISLWTALDKKVIIETLNQMAKRVKL